MRRAPSGTARATAAARARQEAAVVALAEALATHGRGEPVRAIEALASVVINRMRAARARRAPPSWGVDLATTLIAPGLFPEGSGAAAPEPLVAACRRIAARAAAGSLPDPTGGALFWHRAGAPPPPDAPAGETLRLGGLVFIRPAELPAIAEEQGWTVAGRG
jgi:spore germination cell wall hydrolase CwlJ-like protein